MKIIVKTLSGQNFPLEVEGTDTVKKRNIFYRFYKWRKKYIKLKSLK